MLRSPAVRRAAHSVLELAGATAPPIDVEHIAALLGFRVVPYAFPDPAISGMLVVEAEVRALVAGRQTVAAHVLDLEGWRRAHAEGIRVAAEEQGHHVVQEGHVVVVPVLDHPLLDRGRLAVCRIERVGHAVGLHAVEGGVPADAAGRGGRGGRDAVVEEDLQAAGHPAVAHAVGMATSTHGVSDDVVTRVLGYPVGLADRAGREEPAPLEGPGSVAVGVEVLADDARLVVRGTEGGGVAAAGDGCALGP